MSHMKVAQIMAIDLSLRYLLLNQLFSIQRAGYEVVGIPSPGPSGATGFIGSYVGQALMARDDTVANLGRRYQSSVHEEG